MISSFRHDDLTADHVKAWEAVSANAAADDAREILLSCVGSGATLNSFRCHFTRDMISSVVFHYSTSLSPTKFLKALGFLRQDTLLIMRSSVALVSLVAAA